MKISIWGTRGSIPSPSPENNRYGGNTSCVHIESDDSFVVLDAGSGIRRLSGAIPESVNKIDILLTHLHIDHIMGLGFFGPLYNPNMTINIWGPRSTKSALTTRLIRYLSPPLFPVLLRDLPCKLNLLEIDDSHIEIGDLKIESSYVCHPGPTVGYRISNATKVFTYIPDHEPRLGSSNFPDEPEWTSGFDLAVESDLLFHDAQYSREEYEPRVGWGHSSVHDAFEFANMSQVKKMLLFHHDPSHSDVVIDQNLEEAKKDIDFDFEVGVAAEGDVIDL